MYSNSNKSHCFVFTPEEESWDAYKSTHQYLEVKFRGMTSSFIEYSMLEQTPIYLFQNILTLGLGDIPCEFECDLFQDISKTLKYICDQAQEHLEPVLVDLFALNSAVETQFYNMFRSKKLQGHNLQDILLDTQREDLLASLTSDLRRHVPSSTAVFIPGDTSQSLLKRQKTRKTDAKNF